MKPIGGAKQERREGESGREGEGKGGIETKKTIMIYSMYGMRENSSMEASNLTIYHSRKQKPEESIAAYVRHPMEHCEFY